MHAKIDNCVSDIENWITATCYNKMGVKVLFVGTKQQLTRCLIYMKQH